MKSNIYLVHFLLVSSSLFCLPEGKEVVSGKVDFQTVDPQNLKITVSDKAIINYQSFNIDKGEHVQFIQPSDKSIALNRVIGNDPSNIYGRLSANGKLFLVNQHGIYFGPGATVNVGSFIASTLNIKNEDFLNNSFKFYLEPGTEKASIINAGSISSSPEGFIALFAPVIQNRGSIIARAGKAILASAERVTLDFTGDGLIQFSVDGELKKALIENYGTIESLNGTVELTLKSAQDAIRMVVNTDGITPANAIEECNGVIRLVSNSSIAAKRVHIEGSDHSKIDIQGKIDASDATIGEKGGTVHILGDHIQLIDATIDASGDAGGGTVLIGGDYQGKGVVRNAQNSVLNSTSKIYADAYTQGDGGRVILWSDDTTLFDGNIFARGGSESGNGGFVETSGKMQLGIQDGLGYVETSAAHGNFGDWLLDPATITIANAGAGTIAQGSAPNCNTGGAVAISVATMQAAATNVALCAQNAANSSITVNNAFTMAAGVSLSMTAGSTNVGNINLNANITTRGQPISLTGVVVLGAAVTLDTTNAGANPTGGNISLSNTVNGARVFTLNGGTGGTVTLTGAVGGTTALTSLSVSAAAVTQSSTVRATGAVSYSGSSGTTAISIGGNITTTTSGAISMTGLVTVSGAPILTTAGNQNISFSGTINGGTSLTLSAGTGTVSFGGAVGGTTPLTSLSATAGTVTQSSTAKTTGAVSYTGSTIINVNGNITTSGGIITMMTGPVALTTTPLTFDTTNSGGTTAGANISFSSTLNGATALTLNGGTGGTISFTGAVGGTTPLTNLSFTSAALIQIGNNITVTGANPLTFPSPVSLTGTSNITSNNANLTFSNTLNGAQALTLTGGIGTVTLTGAVGGTNPLTNLTFTSAGLIQIGNNITVTGANPLTFPFPVSLTGTSNINSNNNNITFSSTLNGAQALTLTGGTGTVTFTGIVGGTSPLINLSFASAGLIQVGNNITVTGANPLTFSSPVSLTGTSNITSNNANISFNTTLNGAQALTLTGGSGITTFTGAIGGTTPLTSLTATAATVTQSSTAKTTGALSYTGSTAINVGGNITTSGGIITMTGPVAISSTPIFDATNAGGTATGANISFSSSLNGATSLVLKAGTAGVITFTGAVGGTNALTNLSFTSANLIQIGNNITVTGANPLSFPFPVSLTGTSNITSNSASITFGSTINGAQALILTGGSGTTTLTGAVGGTTPLASLAVTAGTITQSSTVKTTGSVGFTGSIINVNGNITTNGGTISMIGPVTISGSPTFDSTNTGSFASGANISFSNKLDGATTLTLNGGTGGTISFNGIVGGTAPLINLSFINANLIQIANNITVTGANPLIFSSPVSLTGTSNITSNSANITFSSTLNGAQALTLTGGTGTTTFTGAVGSTTPLSSLSVTASRITQSSSATASGALTYTGSTAINLFGNIVTSGGIVTMTGPVVINSNLAIDSTNAGGTPAGANINFSSTINDATSLTDNLRLAAGGGSITFSGVVGATPLAILTISSANNVTATNITAGILTQTAGTGTTTFNGPLSTSNALGISLTGAAFTFNNTVTTTSSGGLSIVNSGLLSMPSAATCNLSGPFSQTGTGSVQIGDSITSGDEILFTSAVALTNTTSLSTSAASKSITFMSSIDSVGVTPMNLTLAAGTSNITVDGNIGSINLLGIFQINSANNVTVQGLTANEVVVSSGTGTTTVNGNVLVGSGGISLTGNNFVNNGNVTTTNGGSVTINNSGTATRSPGHTTVVDGNYTLNGPGPAFAGSSLTVKGNVLIVPAVTLVANAVVDTSAGTGSITFSSTIDQTFDLTLNSASFISVGGNIGSSVPIGNFTIGTATNVTLQGVQATSITQTTGTGTTTLSGAVITSGATGISITTNAVTRGAAITTLGGGPLTITNSGLFTSTAAGAINLSGAFTQNGTGAVSLGGSITTAAANISFASPITLGGDTSLSTGSGAGNIILSQTVQGTFGLTLNSGTGNITLGGNVGTVTPLTFLDITNAANVSTQAISAASITQSLGSGTSTFSGALNTTASSGIVLTGTSFTFNNTITTTTGGPLDITNTGVATFNSGATGSISGFFTQTGTGSTQLSSSMTAGGVIQFNGPFTISGTGSLDTSAANQPITFFNTADGPGNLTLASGTADISFQANAGSITPFGSLTITNVHNLTAQAVTAASLTQSAGTGTTQFNGNVNTSGAGGVNLNGSAFTFLQNMTTTGSGPISITNSGTLTTTAGKTISSNGTFTQNGAGAISLAGAISTTNSLAANASISFNGGGAISLTAPASLNTSTGSGAITIAPTVDGGQPLTLTSGTGDITFSSAIGGITPLGTLTVNSAHNLSLQAVTATSISQLAGSGTTTLNGNINTNGAAGITFIVNNITRLGSITTTNGGSITVTNSGLLTGVATTLTIDGSYTQNGTGPVNYSGTIITHTGPISFTSAITLIGPTTYDSSTGSTNIILSNTVDSDSLLTPRALTLKAGVGNITLGGAVGGMDPLGVLTIQSANNITSAAISAASISGSSISGLATFNGALSTSAIAGISLSGSAFTFNNSVTTTGGGVVGITNSGILTVANGTLFNLDGTFTQSGAGSVTFGGSITTTNDAISFAAPLTLTAPVALNTGAGAGDITLSGTIDGATTLNLTAGTGSIDFQSNIGNSTPLTGLTVQSANNVLVDVTAVLSGPFIITSATGTTTLNGTLSASQVNLTGAIFDLNNTVNTTSSFVSITNSGLLTIASLSPITSATSFTQTGSGAVSLGSNITTAGTLSIASAVTLTNNVVLNSGNGTLNLSNTVDGAFNFTLTAGSGDITIGSGIGSTTPIDAFTITSAHDVSAEAITAASISQQAGTGTSLLLGSLTTSTNASITLIGNNFTTSGTITTTSGGPLTITNSGLVTATGTSTIILAGPFTQNGTGPIHTGGTLTTSDANISFTGPVTVALTTIFTSNTLPTTGGDITFINTVDGPACLTLSAGTGDIEFESAVGTTAPLGCLTASGDIIMQDSSLQATGAVQLTGASAIDISGNIATIGNNITLTGTVTTMASLALSTTGGAGDISITGTINGNAAGYNLTIQTGTGNINLSSAVGGNASFNNLTFSANNITLFQLGSGVAAATGTTQLNATSSINFTGTTYNSGTQNYTAGSAFNFTGGHTPVPTISSPVRPITFNTGTMQLASGTDLTIQSFGGTITLPSATPSLTGPGQNLIVNAGTGAMNFVQIGSSGNNLNNVTLTSNAFSPTPVLNSNVFANSLTINSTTPLTISTNQLIGATTYNQPIIFQGNIVYTCGSNGTITFNSTVDAFSATGNSLTLDFSPCGGSVVFAAPVGSTTPLDSISIDSATDVTVSNTMNVGSLSVTNGVGTTTLSSGITSTAAAGISITTPTIHIAGSVSTANGGAVVLDNSGALTIAAGSSFTLSGAFNQTGTGSVSIGGSIMTSDASIQFASPVTLNGSTTLDSTNLSGGAISFASTVQGAQNLTLTSGNQDITFSGIVGTSLTPLDILKINSARNVTTTGIFASTIEQEAGTGTTSLGALSTTGLNGINLVGTAFTFNNNVTTTNGGPLIIDNSGLLTLSNATYSLAGALTQNGSGSSTIAGTFTAGGVVSFAQGVILTGATSIDTSSNSENIIFSSTLNNDGLGPHNLTLNAGAAGSITLTGTVGATPVGVFTISNADNINTGAISATSITQTAGAGITTVSGNLSTTGASGISLSGTNFTINSTVTTTNTGPFSITNSGALSLTLGNSTSIDGAFSQSGGGAVSLSGTLTTNSQPISFANAITLSGTTSLSTGTGSGTITLSSTVDGNFPLSLTAGTGSIVFSGSLGSTTPLGALTVNSVQNVTYPLVNAASIVQTASTGTTTITGSISTSALLGIAISGGVINQNGAITTLNGGPIAFTNTGTLTIGIGVNTTASGSYTQSGGGSVSLGGSITAVNNPISMVGPIALTADVTLDSGPVVTNSINISITDAITGAHALTLTAAGGTISLGGDVGTLATPLTSFTITNANTVSTEKIYAGSITQTQGTGTTTFNDLINASGVTGITLTGTAFTFNNTVTTTSGPLTLTNSGLVDFTAAATGSISGTLTQNGTGGFQLSSSITAGGAVSFTGPFTVSGSGSLDTSAANQPITFSNTVDGPGNLTLSTGTNDITMGFNAGFTTRLGALQITTARNVTTQAIKAASITQSAGSNLSQFNGDLNTNGASGISLAGAQFTFLGNLTTTNSGPITITNSGTLTTTASTTFSSNGIFTQNGSGSVMLANNITTTNPTAANANINFSGTSAITLIAPVNIDSSTGGGTITFSASSTVDGHQPMTLKAGTGDINISGAFGGTTPLGAFTVTNANNITVQAITADSISQLAGSGTSTLDGILITNTPAGITLIGNNFSLGATATAVTTTNGGSITITNQGVIQGSVPVTFSIDNAFIQNGPGTTFIGGPITTNHGGISFTGPAIFTTTLANVTLDSSTLGGNIIFSNRVSGGSTGTKNVVLKAGTGSITLSQVLGSTAPIGPFTVTALDSLTATGNSISISDIGTTLASGVTGTTSLTALDDIIFTGTIYNANTQTYTVTSVFNMESGALTTFSSSGSVMTFSGGDIDLSTGTDLTMNTGGSSLTLQNVNAQTNNHRHLILNAGAGNIQIGDLGIVGGAGNGEFASASFTGTNLTLGHEFADAFTFNYTGTLFANGDIVSTDTVISFPSAVVLQATNIFSTVATTGAGITFSGTLDGLTSDTFGLTLTAGSGNIAFSNTIGATHRLSNLKISSAADVQFSAATIVDALEQLAGSGTTTFNGTLTVPTNFGIQLTGTNFTFNNTVHTTTNGGITITNSGTATISSTGAFTLSGAFTQNSSTGPVTLAGSITAGQPISFSGPVTLSGNPSLDTSAANQMITFINAVNGPGNITLSSGGGDIFLQSNDGATSPLGAITVQTAHNVTAQSVSATSISLGTVSRATGLVMVMGAINTSGSAGISLLGTNFSLNGSVTTTGGGSVTVNNSGLLSSSASSTRTIDGSYMQTGSGPVQFGGTLTTTNGIISFNSPVTLPINAVFDSSAANQDIAFMSTLDGPGSFSANAGGGNISITQLIGNNNALTNFSVTSANDINLHGVGDSASGVTGTLSLTCSDNINLFTTSYNANAQIYSAGNNINFNAGSLTTLTSFNGAITFTHGTIQLSTGNDLEVVTNNGNFSFISLFGTTSENVTINTGTGAAGLNVISTPGPMTINNLLVNSGAITFSGAIQSNTINLTSLSAISNTGAQVNIVTPNTIFLNALAGDVGTLTNPILINSGQSPSSTGEIFAGAHGLLAQGLGISLKGLADFDGVSVDGTIHSIPSNVPCEIIFNNVIIQNCSVPPVPPIPPVPGGGVVVIVGTPFVFAVPGFDSSSFNLASDYFFLPYFLDDTYLRKDVAIYYRAPAKARAHR